MRGAKLAGLIALAIGLEVGAAVGISYVAGFGDVSRALGHLVWWWLVVMAGSLVVSSAGYYYACKGIYEVDGGPKLPPSQLLSVVLAGFGGFFSHGGGTLDRYGLRAAGADETDANVRVMALAGLEHGVLGLLGSAAGIAVLAADMSAPPLDFSLPWAVIPVPGFIVAFWLADRYEPLLSGKSGWRGKAGNFLRSVRFIHRLFTTDLVSTRPAVIGLGVFWGGDIFAIWAALAAFGFHMDGAQVILGVGTGMVFTRRTGPLGGSGVLMLTLPLTLWYSGAPLAVSVAAIFCYRIASTWLPMPVTLAQLPTLREMAKSIPGAEGTASEASEPALPNRQPG